MRHHVGALLRVRFWCEGGWFNFVGEVGVIFFGVIQSESDWMYFGSKYDEIRVLLSTQKLFYV